MLLLSLSLLLALCCRLFFCQIIQLIHHGILRELHISGIFLHLFHRFAVFLNNVGNYSRLEIFILFRSLEALRQLSLIEGLTYELLFALALGLI